MKRSTKRRYLYALGIPLLSYLPFWIFFFGGVFQNPAMQTPLGYLLFVSLIVLVYGALIAHVRMLRNTLREKGFNWIGTMETGQLRVALGSHVHRIPPRDQLATLPGYKEGDIESIIDLMERTTPRR